MRNPIFGALLCVLLFVCCKNEASARTWEVTSPDQGQTFAFGSERHQAWIARNNHLGIVMEFTNDPYVDQINFRQYDDFSFNFPEIRLGSDGETFFFSPSGQHRVAVATRHPGLFGAEVSLLPGNRLIIDKSHGLLRLTLLVSDKASAVARE